MGCSLGMRASNRSAMGNRVVGEVFTIECVLAERGVFSRYLARDHRTDEIRLVELQSIEPREQTAWLARADMARRMRHPCLVRCLESRILSDTQGLLVFEEPVEGLIPERLESEDVARVGLSLASLLMLLHRVGFGFQLPLIHRTFWDKGRDGLGLRVEALARVVGGFHREPFCAWCHPEVPPELAEGSPPSPLGDLFILGAFLYRLLKGTSLEPSRLERTGPEPGGLEYLICQLVQSDPGRRPQSVEVAWRFFRDILKDGNGETEPPPSFGWIEPRIPPRGSRALARSFVVPGLSLGAVECLAKEETDMEKLAGRITDAVWKERSRKPKKNESHDDLRCLEREGKVREALKLAEALGGAEAKRIWARLVWRSSESRRADGSPFPLDAEEFGRLEAIRLRQEGKLRQAEEALSRLHLRSFYRWLELARLAMMQGNGLTAEEAFRRAVTEADSLVEEARGRAGLGEQLARMGRLREGKEEIGLARELLSEGEEVLELREVLLIDATVDIWSGRWQRARTTLEELAREGASHGDAWLRQESLMRLAELGLKTGCFADAQAHIEEALRLAERRRDTYGRWSAHLMGIESHARGGQWVTVLKGTKNLKRHMEGVPFGRLRLQISLLFARAAVECGRMDEAAEALAEIRQQLRPLSEPAMDACFDQVVALFLARRGRSHEAALVFERAIEVLEGASHPFLLAELYKDFVFTCSGSAPAGLVRLRRQAAQRTAKELGAKPLLHAIDHESAAEEGPTTPSLSGFVASSPVMIGVLERIERASGFDVPVHLRGESGTGKELVARGIHSGSARSGKNFVAFNCAALPDSLLEAELFGHARGAFTGADRARVGLLEEAHGGTLFLDEVAELSPRGQSLLLRVLQDKEYRRLGDSTTRHSDFRLISATHRRLEDEVAQGRFREDLYFRLKVVEIEIPPLRDRRGDILPLARHFLGVKSAELRIAKPALSLEAERALTAGSWRGNVRELENEIVQALLRLGKSSQLGPEHLSPSILAKTQSPLRFASQDFEKRFLRDALARHRGNRTRAAQALGLTRQALYKKMRKYGMAICQAG